MTRIIEVIYNRCLINGITSVVEPFVSLAANGTAIGRCVAAEGTEGQCTRNDKFCMVLYPIKIIDLETLPPPGQLIPLSAWELGASRS